MNVSAVIVTRGNVDLTPILERLSISSFDCIIVANNSDGSVRLLAHPDARLAPFRGVVGRLGGDLAVYGRYAAIDYAHGDLVYVQDDDCLVDAEKVVDAWLDLEGLHQAEHSPDPQAFAVANMPSARHQDPFPLVGWGCVFPRWLPERAFARWRDTGAALISEDVFQRECDVVFAMLTQVFLVDVGFQHLPWAEGPGRMWTDGGEVRRFERASVYEFARSIRVAD